MVLHRGFVLGVAQEVPQKHPCNRKALHVLASRVGMRHPQSTANRQTKNLDFIGFRLKQILLIRSFTRANGIPEIYRLWNS